MTIKELKNFLDHPYDKIRTREGYTVEVNHPFITLAREILALVEAADAYRKCRAVDTPLEIAESLDLASDAFNAKMAEL